MVEDDQSPCCFPSSAFPSPTSLALLAQHINNHLPYHSHSQVPILQPWCLFYSPCIFAGQYATDLRPLWQPLVMHTGSEL